jgi:phosphate transport system permease protein
MSIEATPRPDIFAPTSGLASRKFWDTTFVTWGILATALGLVVLAALGWGLFSDGMSKLTPNFFMSFPSADPKSAGILSAWVGSLLVLLTTAAVAIPLGVMAGVYLEEYAPRNAVTAFLEITINNLAGVPSIIYGLLGLGLFVYTLNMGQTVLVAGMTLALLILPVIIVASREAVRSVPRGIREAAMAVGATKWQATSHHVVPYATPGIVTGVIIGISRAVGETAPLIVIGIPTFVAFLPIMTPGDLGKTYYDANGNEVAIGAADIAQSWVPFGDGGWLNQSVTVMPMQMFNWTQRPEPEFLQNAAAAGIVLLVITLLLNGAAIYLRYQLRKRIRW